jgi:hypothetical protein
MTSDATATRPTAIGFENSEGLVRRYRQANPPLAAGEVLPAIPDEFVAALERADGHDRAAFRQLLADFHIDDAAALRTILRVIRHYGATEALGWVELEMNAAPVDR